jgi:hypothetical protein
MEPIFAFASAAISRVEVAAKPFSPNSLRPASISAALVFSAEGRLPASFSLSLAMEKI